jgi:hypothetical protein
MPGCTGCASASGDRFKGVPPITPMPPVGWFNIAPSGPGYYSIQDQLTDNYRQGPPKYPYMRIGPCFFSFFDADWSYLDKPDNTEHDFFDCLKRQRFGCDDLFMNTMGGEFRARYNYEGNSRLLNTGPVQYRGRDNNYDLYRLRVYDDLWITEDFRIFAELISATSPDYLLQPQTIDRQWFGIQNLFGEARLFEVDNTPVWFRFGRQELLYGSQRLISPLDWANTRRTFQGLKTYWHSENLNLDAFVVQPVIPTYDRFNSVDNNQVFAGLWGTYKIDKNTMVDAYYLMLDNTNPIFTGRGGVKGGQTVHTWGSRSVGQTCDGFLWDFEGMIQGGTNVNQNLFAGAATAGVGWYFKDAPWTPTLWGYYDWASGTSAPGTGNYNNTFNQLFPFGHYYFGWIDVVGRRNIQDLNAELTVYPTNWLFAQLQCHNFWLDSARDALYNSAGNAIRQDPTGKAGTSVGTELDFILNFHLDNHQDILLSYSYLFVGDFIITTATTPGGKDNASALYVQYSFKW